MASPHIGTLREKPLHASLKEWCARPGDRFEVPVEGFVVDVVRDELLIEIQTRGFSSMKKKLAALLEAGHSVRIVYPVAMDRWLVKLDDDGTVLDRRKSPKHGGFVDVFSELVSIPTFVDDPRFEVEVVLVAEEEYRVHEPGKAWRRKGWTVLERRLLDVLESKRLASGTDLVGLMPNGIPEVFTTADLSVRLGRSRRLAQQMAYCLRETGALEVVGKTGNALNYRVA